MGKRQFVQRRGGMLHFRRKYPLGVAGKFYKGKKLGKEFKRTLGTGSYNELDRRYCDALDLFDLICRSASATRQRSNPDAKSVVSGKLLRPLSDLGRGEEFEILAAWFSGEYREVEPRPLNQIADQIVRDRSAEAAAYLNPEDPGSEAALQELAASVLQKHGFQPERNHRTFARFEDIMARARAYLRDRDVAMIEGRKSKVSTDPDIEEFVRWHSARPLNARGNRKTLSDLVASYSKHREQENRSEKTRLTDELLARTMLEAFGANTELSDIDVEKCRSFRALVVRLPANFTKLYPKTELTQIPELAKRDGRDPMSPKNALKYIARLKAVFAHGIDVERWMDHNPAKSIKIKPDARVSRKYATFTHDELKQLFTAPIFTGCEDAGAGALMPGPVVPNNSSRFWVPLIGLYSGMRQGEICQLHVADIRQKVGIWVISVTDLNLSNESEPSGKSVKTKDSKRDLPINPELVRLGLLDFAQHRRNAGAKHLFVEQETPKHADSFQKWFKRLRKSRGLTRKGLVFHSLRHTFRQALRVGRTDIEVARTIGGWAGLKWPEPVNSPG